MPPGSKRRDLHERYSRCASQRRCVRARRTGRRVAAAAAPAPLDPQNWSWQDNLTWNDYKTLPGTGLLGPEHPADGQEVEGRARRDRLPGQAVHDHAARRAATVFGTPTAEANNIPRADVPRFYRDFLNKPQALNHFQTMNRYWMEDSFGKYGVQLDAFGPYKLPGAARTSTSCNDSGSSSDRALPDADAARRATELPHRRARRLAGRRRRDRRSRSYDNIFYVSAGEDESSTWQEFGEMKWMTQDEVPDAFGPKAVRRPTQTNWAADALRAVVLVGLGRRPSGRTPRATRRSRARAPACRRTRTSCRTTSTSRTTTATRTATDRSSAASPACGT